MRRPGASTLPVIVSWTRPPGGTASEADGKSGCALGTAGVEDQGFSGKLTLTLSAGNLRAVAGSSDLGHQTGRAPIAEFPVSLLPLWFSQYELLNSFPDVRGEYCFGSA